MQERREAKRRQLDAPVSLSVQGIDIRARLLNISSDGALFQIDRLEEGKISTMDLGKDATFLLRIKSAPDREYTGEIIRFFLKNNDKYIALRFWEGYRELPH